jgi:hypothetical protein
MPLPVQRPQTVLLQVVADRRWISADELADLLKGQALSQIVL